MIKVKLVVFLVCIIACFSCGDMTSKTDQNVVKKCTYNSFKISLFDIGSDVPFTDTIIKGCFLKSTDKQGLIHLQNKESKISVFYHNGKSLSLFDLVLNTNIMKFNTLNDDDVFFKESNDTLNVVFGDRINRKLKGIVSLY
jgi:hypothetical protein